MKLLPLMIMALFTVSLHPVVEQGEAAEPPQDQQGYTSPEKGGPRNFETLTRLNLREQPSTASMVLTRFAPGTILDNLGCEYAGEIVWCDVQQLGGGPRGFVAAAYLKPAVSPNGQAMVGPDDSALRAGQGKFDATGKLSCSISGAQSPQSCDFGVARAGGGYATVVIKRPDGRSRALYFRMNVAIGADTSQADGYPDFASSREDDTHIIVIGDERYVFPDIVVLGD
jgi:hypothetical protein